MNPEHLRAFLAVLETGTFSEAALELDVSQPTVSYAIRELERDLGVRLFDRGRAGANPTGAGAALAAHARAVLQAHAALRQQAALQQDRLRGTLRVAAYPSTASRVLPAVLARVNERHPELELDVAVIDGNERNAAALAAREVDAAFFIDAAPDAFIAWEAYREAYAAYLPEAWADPAVVDREELASRPLVLHRDTECERAVDAYLERIGVPVRPAVRVRDATSQLHMVAQGLGAAILVQPDRTRMPEGVRMRALDPPLERTFLVAIQPEGLRTPAVRAFLAVLGEILPDAAVPGLPARGAVPG